MKELLKVLLPPPKMWYQCNKYYSFSCISSIGRGRRGRDRVVVGFTTIYSMSAYHH